MNEPRAIHLGVNVDHVATLRQARGVDYPDPVEAALLAETAGADSITVHLREDRRHIQPHDVSRLREILDVPLNLEMAATADMVAFALEIKPPKCCLVPERREELTTEGGLDVVGQVTALAGRCGQLADAGIEVSLFIDPDADQISAASTLNVPVVELHTGRYAEAADRARELQSLRAAAELAGRAGIQVNAGHGLTVDNVAAVAQIPELVELNIGHAIVARALFLGFEGAVREMRETLDGVRS